MRDERREPMRDSDTRQQSTSGPRQTSDQEPDTAQHGERRGPFTYTVGWLGHAFDRDQLNKREAEERRNRNM